MTPDELAIRDAHARWIEAVNAADLDGLLALMTHDVVFLNPGQAPIGRDGFGPGFREGHRRNRIACVSVLQEAEVAGDVAFHAVPGFAVRRAARRLDAVRARRRPAHDLAPAGRRALAAGARCAHVDADAALRALSREAVDKRIY